MQPLRLCLARHATLQKKEPKATPLMLGTNSTAAFRQPAMHKALYSNTSSQCSLSAPRTHICTHSAPHMNTASSGSGLPVRILSPGSYECSACSFICLHERVRCYGIPPRVPCSLLHRLLVDMLQSISACSFAPFFSRMCSGLGQCSKGLDGEIRCLSQYAFS
jgi:hypothetical protein